MRKQYEKPQAEKIEFNYTDVVVASSAGVKGQIGHPGGNGCYSHNKNASTGCIPKN